MSLMRYALLALKAGLVVTQQVYVSSNSTAPACSPSPTLNASLQATTPTYQFSSFAFTLTETVRVATPVQSQPATTFGPSYEEASGILPSFSTTSWGNYRPSSNSTSNSTIGDSGPFGQAAFSSIWAAASLSNITTGLYSTTVSPTPIPTSELVYPPPLYFKVDNCLAFPEDFILGVSGAAAQIEGAISDEGRTPAIVDFLGALAAAIQPTVPSADDFTAIENYYLYKQDIERLAAIGIKHYSFSISWTRILPFALPGTPVNSEALAHYNDLIDFILEKGMVPIVTLTHFDTPAVFIGGTMQGLLERMYLGRINFGYQNETFQEAFVNYGKLVMTHFADRVPFWLTFNEPQAGVNSGPSVDNIIKSHAQLHHFYHEQLNGTGQVSLKMGEPPGIPQIPTNQSHIDAAMHRTQLYINAYLNPLALGLDYPDAYKMTVQDYVPLTNEDLAYLNNTVDFVAADIYTAPSVYPVVDNIAACAAINDTTINPNYPSCVGTTQDTVTGWRMGYHAEYMSYTTPIYLRTQLSYYWNTFRKPIMITEFGFSLPPLTSDTLEDERFDIQRSEHYISSLNEMLLSIWEDKVHLLGAIMWSYADNWEWGTFDHRFGLQYTNRTTQERSYRRSLFDTINFYESRKG